MDQRSQAVRFEALSQIADLTNHAVLDAGCGYGDLYAYLGSLYPNINYSGIEQIPELLEEAERRYGSHPETTFLPGNFMTVKLAPTDYVLASGSLNYHSEDPQFIYKAIAKLYSSCTLGLGFNLLRHIPHEGVIVAYDAQLILNYCQTLSPRVVFLDDYDTDDFTLFLYR